MKNPDFPAVKEREAIHKGLHEMHQHLFGDRQVGTQDEVTSLVDLAVVLGQFTEAQALTLAQYVSHVIAASAAKQGAQLP